jgi:hypothetical protein
LCKQLEDGINSYIKVDKISKRALHLPYQKKTVPVRYSPRRKIIQNKNTVVKRGVSIFILTLLLSFPFQFFAGLTSSIHSDRAEDIRHLTDSSLSNDTHYSQAPGKHLDDHRSDKKLEKSVLKQQRNPAVTKSTTSMLHSVQVSFLNQTVQDNVTTLEGTALADHADSRAILVDIVEADHLDQNKTFLANITEAVKEKDRMWSESISSGQYVRVEFETPLDSYRDITIVARSQGQSTIEVYEKDSGIIIATFQITTEHRYQILLTNLTASQSTFDLRTLGDPVEYDYIVDPTTGWISPTGYLDPSGQWTTETKAYDDNVGTYAANTGAVGWQGYLQLNISSAIYCDRVRVYSDFDTYYVDKISLSIYNSTSWIEKYNGTITDGAWTELEFTGETNVTKARFRYHYVRGSVYFWFYEFDFWQGKPHTLPNCTTLNATSIDETTAVVKGNVTDDGGEPCEYRFQYGLTTAYGINTSWSGSEPQGAEFGTMIHNLTLGVTYQYRVQLRNDVGTMNGSNKNFTTALPSLGWVSPTGCYDPDSKWTNEVNINDDETDTCAQSNHAINAPQWGSFIYLNHSVLLCDKIRFYARGPTADPAKVDQVDLDVRRGGVWYDILNATFTDKQWVEARFTQGSVTSARVRFHVNAANSGLYFELYEFDFNNSRPVPMIMNEGPANRSWGVALRPLLNITVNNPDGAAMTIYWYSNSSGSWQLFGTNSSVGNGSYHWRNNNFSTNNTRYWWKVIVTDGTDTNTSAYYFSTPDYLKPTSSITTIASYWKKTSPLAITATASDPGWSGLKNVTLYYYNSSSNSTWYGPWKFGVVTTPWSGISWSFTFPKGTGYYRFYSISVDNATNTEVFTGNDTRAGYDTAAPASSITSFTGYWKKTSPIIITATASDSLSGVKNITVFYRFSATNTSWGSWMNAGVDTAAPWSWSVAFSNGTGYYQYYSVAKDNATNAEAAPGSPDAMCGYDPTTPTSSVSSVQPYWTTTQPVSLTVTASDTGGSGLKNVSLYYYTCTNNNTWGGPWKFGATNTTPWVAPIRWSFSFPNGTAFYRFYSVACDNATNQETITGNDTACGYDVTAPSSSLDAITCYWRSSAPLTVNATASDAISGVKNVTLYYRFSSSNTSWGGYVNAGVDTTAPWSWSFSFSNGTGYYQFYSIAQDNVTHVEATPGWADASCGFDTFNPSSSVDAITPFWTNTATTVTATASDIPSGVKNITLWYRFCTDNASWGEWMNAGIDTSMPWSWSFGFLNGSGYYQFYCIAEDNATNSEPIPGGADSWCGYENLTPASSVDAITDYWITSSSYTVTATANDPGMSGVKNVTLYYRFRPANTSSWGGYVSFGVDPDPWNSCSWNFTFPSGSGHYEFYSIAVDNATNTEVAPGVNGDVECGFSNAIPFSQVDGITPYWTSIYPLNISATADADGPSGLDNVTLYYYHSLDNMTWSGPWEFGIDADPWNTCSWEFTFPNDTGWYRFYSIALDNSSTKESVPLVNDTSCGFDNQAPTCTINYNRSTGFFKGNDVLRIYANFTENHSGMNESSVLICIQTQGDGDLANHSMMLSDNTHWYYDWMIPDGSDDDGRFDVLIYGKDDVHNLLTPYPTNDSSREIDNTLPCIANVSVDNISPRSASIEWMTDEIASNSIEYGVTSAYGCTLNTPGLNTAHSMLLTGLIPFTTYHFRVVSYDRAGNRNTSTDYTFITSQEKSLITATQGLVNNPPSPPIIDGPITGKVGSEYTYTAHAIDPDNDSLDYSFDWGDAIIVSSGFIPHGSSSVQHHLWNQAGKYILRVTVRDNLSSAWSEELIWIDALPLGAFGYLLDINGNNVYDAFHDNESGIETVVEMKGESYLIDADGNHVWDYEYNMTSGVLSLMNHYQVIEEDQPFIPLLWIIGMSLILTLVLIMVFFLRHFTRRSNKK